jgi:hypothetical protein
LATGTHHRRACAPAIDMATNEPLPTPRGTARRARIVPTTFSAAPAGTRHDPAGGPDSCPHPRPRRTQPSVAVAPRDLDGAACRSRRRRRTARLAVIRTSGDHLRSLDESRLGPAADRDRSAVSHRRCEHRDACPARDEY